MIHNCKEWLEEAIGCSICSRKGLISLKDLKETQEHINWKISDLNKQNKNLKSENKQLRIQTKNLQKQIIKLINGRKNES